MRRKRLLWLVPLLLMAGVVWKCYRIAYRAGLDHDLIVACGKSYSEEVRALLDRGADPNAYEPRTYATGWRHLLNLLLHREQSPARIYPLGQIMRRICDESIDPDNSGNRLPLNKDHIAIVRLLLEHGVNPNASQPDEFPHLILAIDTRNESLVKLLLEHGANVNRSDWLGTPTLMYMQYVENTGMVKSALEHGANPNLTNGLGDSALLWAACYQEPEIVKLLLAHGADVNHKNGDGYCALTYAVTNVIFQEEQTGAMELRHRATVNALLAAGADVNALDGDGGTPFLFALIRNDTSIADLLAHGADVRRVIPHTSTLPISWAVEGDAGGSGYNVTPDTTPLMFAVKSGDVELVRRMLAMGAQVDPQDGEGKTARTYAQESKETDPDSERIRVLLQQAGALH